LLRAANTGVSAGFDAKGHELGRLNPQITGVLPVRLPTALPVPLYAQIGLLLPGVGAVVFMIAGLFAIPTRRILSRANFYTS
jgi:apolipoprotein N-acyltransferase